MKVYWSYTLQLKYMWQTNYYGNHNKNLFYLNFNASGNQDDYLTHQILKIWIQAKLHDWSHPQYPTILNAQKLIWVGENHSMQNWIMAFTKRSVHEASVSNIFSKCFLHSR